jgi:hypothetical protein
VPYAKKSKDRASLRSRIVDRASWVARVVLRGRTGYQALMCGASALASQLPSPDGNPTPPRARIRSQSEGYGHAAQSTCSSSALQVCKLVSGGVMNDE